MIFRYPNGKVYQKNDTKEAPRTANPNYGKRGMTLEDDINETNLYYLKNHVAVIHKKPTPVQIVKVDYPKRSAAVIKEAYFKQASTTDYNGIYKGRYIDFEAKETRNKTAFPLQNFHEHQIKHMEDVLRQNGICFVILRFSLTDELFFLEAEKLLVYWNRQNNGGRKSISKTELLTDSEPIGLGYQPRIDYIKIIDKLYFKS